MLQNLPLIVCPPVQVDLTIDIQPDVIELPAANGERFVPIHPPCAHSGPGPVSARLISYMLHEGQVRAFAQFSSNTVTLIVARM